MLQAPPRAFYLTEARLFYSKWSNVSSASDTIQVDPGRLGPDLDLGLRGRVDPGAPSFREVKTASRKEIAGVAQHPDMVEHRPVRETYYLLHLPCRGTWFQRELPPAQFPEDRQPGILSLALGRLCSLWHGWRFYSGNWRIPDLRFPLHEARAWTHHSARQSYLDAMHRR